MADGNVTVTTAANFIPELWRDAILDYAERKFQIKNQVSDFSSMLAGGGDILHIPKVTEETAAAKWIAKQHFLQKKLSEVCPDMSVFVDHIEYITKIDSVASNKQTEILKV